MQERHEAAGRGKAAVRRVGALESTLPPRYRRQAWLAVAALLVFIGLYAALAGWFLRKAWKLSFGSGAPQFFGLVAAACAALIAAFMIKGLFFIRRGKPEGLVALRREEQPRLFEFLHTSWPTTRAHRGRTRSTCPHASTRRSSTTCRSSTCCCPRARTSRSA
ncbi:MAG: hypothetical protein ACJ8G1_26385 [Vitreoscilla sp.]